MTARTSLPTDFFELYNQRSGIDGFTIAMLAVNGLLLVRSSISVTVLNGSVKAALTGWFPW